MSFYGVMKGIFKPIVKVLFRVKVTGEEMPMDGNILICANHTSMLDVAVIVVSLKRKVHFMAKKELFKFKPIGKFFSAMGAFPVDRGGADVGSLKRAISMVEQGCAVSVFPQGKRYKKTSPVDTEVKHGIGLIAYRSGCDVVPIYIKTKNNHVHFFGKTELIIGSKIENGKLGFSEGGTKEYKRAASVVFSKICALGGYDYPVYEDKSEKDTGAEDKQ